MTTDSPNLITPDSIIYSLAATSRAGAFQEMIDHLVEKQVIPAELRPEILEALETRESKMSTAIGRELAIPHAAIHDLPAVVKLLARSEQGITTGIENGPQDGLPVKYFYLSLIPDDDYSTHLRTIASISSFFRDDANLDRLKAASSPQELTEIFSAS